MEFNDGSQYRIVTNPAAYKAERTLYCARAASATNGVTPYVDTAFAQHRADFASGVVGLCFYQFVYTGAGSPEAQAEFLITNCLGGALRSHEMVMIDTESGGGFDNTNVQDWTRRWLAVIEPRLNTKAWVYVPSALSAGLPRSFTGDRIVMAPRYSGTATRGLAPAHPYDIHQYSDVGYFPGVGAPGTGDVNYTDLTSEQILARSRPSGAFSPCGGQQ